MTLRHAVSALAGLVLLASIALLGIAG